LPKPKERGTARWFSEPALSESKRIEMTIGKALVLSDSYSTYFEKVFFRESGFRELRGG
jgi:hypothetical protein